MPDSEETKNTTFTFKPSTERTLLNMYPDAIGLNEALRNAIADARLVRERGEVEITDDDADAD